MSASLRWDGLADLQRALRLLPSHLTEQATGIVVGNVERAVGTLRAAYPLGPTGNLRRRVLISKIESGPYGAGLMLKSAAPHARLFEYGTAARHTSLGWRRGKMPARPIFGRTAARARREMWRELAGMMRREGLIVTEHV